jgi:uncharacterized protein
MIALPRLLAALLTLVSAATLAAPQFPPLTGRVVDEAGILSPQFESEISAQLAAHEKAATTQIVVVTLKSLGGYDIADYGYQLGRHWGIGQKGKNNGALLIVAPAERKMRIEVGYGLEGALTDAVSRDILERRLKPAFRQQNYEQGIRDGVTAILAAIAGEYQAAAPPVSAVPGHAQDTGDIGGFLIAMLVALVSAASFFRRRLGKSPARIIPAGLTGGITGLIIWIISGLLVFAIIFAVIVFIFMLFAGGRHGGGFGGSDWGSGSGGGWSSGGGGGGFSGGGGSFGGGGASGDW